MITDLDENNEKTNEPLVQSEIIDSSFKFNYQNLKFCLSCKKNCHSQYELYLNEMTKVSREKCLLDKIQSENDSKIKTNIENLTISSIDPFYFENKTKNKSNNLNLELNVSFKKLTETKNDDQLKSLNIFKKLRYQSEKLEKRRIPESQKNDSQLNFFSEKIEDDRISNLSQESDKKENEYPKVIIQGFNQSFSSEMNEADNFGIMKQSKFGIIENNEFNLAIIPNSTKQNIFGEHNISMSLLNIDDSNQTNNFNDAQENKHGRKKGTIKSSQTIDNLIDTKIKIHENKKKTNISKKNLNLSNFDQEISDSISNHTSIKSKNLNKNNLILNQINERLREFLQKEKKDNEIDNEERFRNLMIMNLNLTNRLEFIEKNKENPKKFKKKYKSNHVRSKSVDEITSKNIIKNNDINKEFLNDMKRELNRLYKLRDTQVNIIDTQDNEIKYLKSEIQNLSQSQHQLTIQNGVKDEDFLLKCLFSQSMMIDEVFHFQNNIIEEPYNKNLETIIEDSQENIITTSHRENIKNEQNFIF